MSVVFWPKSSQILFIFSKLSLRNVLFHFEEKILKIASRLFVTLRIYQRCISDIASIFFRVFWKDLTYFQLGKLSFYGKKFSPFFETFFKYFYFIKMS